MNTILIIAGATTLISFGGMIFAYLTRKQELSPKALPQTTELAQRVAHLEAKLADQETKLLQLEESARFTAKLLEKDRT